MAAASHDVVDCDIHPAIGGIKPLLPYLDEYWYEHITSRGAENLILHLTSSPPHAPLSVRPDWRPETGLPGGRMDDVRKHALDKLGATIGILNPLSFAHVMHAEDMAAVMCRAVNDMIAKEWLDKDTRFRASIAVTAAQSPQLAVEEIERRADDKRFVQVLILAQNDMPLGKRHYWPIYETAERHGLPIAVHAGSAYRHAPSYAGYPAYFVEEYTGHAASFKGVLLSLITEGALGKFPGLKFVLTEAGFTWLPSFMWRVDKIWRGVRREIPWVKDAPSDLIRRQVRFTLQPVDAPEDDPEPLARVLDQIGSDDVLLYSTDYPHWHFDGNDAFPKGFPESLKKKVQSDNPLATYARLRAAARPKERETA